MACPMCRRPVTFGGGIGSTYGCFEFDSFACLASGSKHPDFSHHEYISDSNDVGSYLSSPRSLLIVSYPFLGSVAVDTARAAGANGRDVLLTEQYFCRKAVDRAALLELRTNAPRAPDKVDKHSQATMLFPAFDQDDDALSFAWGKG
jgi:hypothetical protein